MPWEGRPLSVVPGGLGQGLRVAALGETVGAAGAAAADGDVEGRGGGDAAAGRTRVEAGRRERDARRPGLGGEVDRLGPVARSLTR